MRVSVNPLDAAALPWEKSSETVKFKLLNGNRKEGAHTMLLQSQPREPNPQRGQYHPVDEEIYVLGGDFTFDGATWFKKGSYAFYPAHFVHGTKVHVRGGYDLYVRISGTNKLHWEENPKSDTPYVAAGHEDHDYAVQLVTANAAKGEHLTPALTGLTAKPLHSAPYTNEGSTLISFSNIDYAVVFEASGLIEILSLSGTFQIANQKAMQANTYVCDSAERASITVSCEKPGDLLVSHGGPLKIRAG